MKVCTTCGAEYGDDQLFCQRDGTPLRKSGAAGDLLGQVIADRYHITKKLGEGGMGQVYLAEHVKMGRRCAIKIMMPGTMSDPDAISRFNREAANASRISHPNVCAIYDFGETPDGLIYLAMEFIEGKSLSGLLEEVGTLPLARAAAITTQTAEALQVAHDLGIVHRDLKPDNIMVVTARGKDTVKVVDFGIAKAVGGDDGKAQKVTKTGFVVGTPEYMSPEQLSGDAVDGRSDLYSLGLVFYRMLTGASPFPADSQQETMIKRLTDDPVPLAVARPETKFPAEVQQVLDRALSRMPDHRYKNAGDFARDVRALASVSTGMVDAEAGTQVVRQEDLKAAVPATRVDPAAARSVKGAAGTQPIAAAPRAAAPARKGAPVMPIAAGVAVVVLAGGGFLMKDKLFGGAPTPAGQDSTQLVAQGADTTKPAGGTSQDPGPVVPLSHPDTTTKPPADGNVRPNNGGGRTSDPPRTDPVPAGPDPTVVAARLKPFYDDPDWVESPTQLAEGKRVARQAYDLATMPKRTRAQAAFVLYQGYLKEQDRTQAKRWLDEAIALDPGNSEYEGQLRVFAPPSQ